MSRGIDKDSFAYQFFEGTILGRICALILGTVAILFIFMIVSGGCSGGSGRYGLLLF